MEPAKYEIQSLPLNPNAPDAWVEVRGGGLTHRVEVKVRMLGPGKPGIFALRIDDQEPITSRQLRELRLPDIAKAVTDKVKGLMEDLEKRPEAFRELAHDLASWEAYVRGDGAQGDGGDELKALAEHLAVWVEGVADADTALAFGERGRGARTPTEEEYLGFAKVYLEELLAEPTSAAARTSRRLNISRATTYRWIAACRDRDLLPREEK